MPTFYNAHFYLFQSTRPQGARPDKAEGADNAKCFNPRARRGRDTASDGTDANCKRFNPRARRGRDCPIISH
ncbi:hypothetical protein MELB17_02175 [Marinobacter sp. ELB17]|nr:hypothetical protein MELB17_02175 [Marinobacter sp. ELB17]